MASYKLYMFAGKRGNAEKIRILLAETGIRYSEVAVTEKSFEALQKDLMFGDLPALHDGSKFIEGHANIMEYLARTADDLKKGHGSNKYAGLPEHSGAHRGIALACSDFQNAAQVWNGPDAAGADFVSKKVPEFFTYLQSLIAKNDDGDVRTEEYTFARSFTYADITAFDAVDQAVDTWGSGILNNFGKVAEFRDKVAKRARVDHYLSTRPAVQ